MLTIRKRNKCKKCWTKFSAWKYSSSEKHWCYATCKRCGSEYKMLTLFGDIKWTIRRLFKRTYESITTWIFRKFKDRCDWCGKKKGENNFYSVADPSFKKSRTINICWECGKDCYCMNCGSFQAGIEAFDFRKECCVCGAIGHLDPEDFYDSHEDELDYESQQYEDYNDYIDECESNYEDDSDLHDDGGLYDELS